ncbi:FtsX-like permease family protein [Amycolatopsis roodepoortensis]|uniref:ABC transport system permease protein n=1 Tax=Amycolatopsis roodepoortensis TaxID=700274 RepID=A0ABR9L1Z0_9PSEU|nr:FtsX-like permease family protein [Amycolatopsis roodepoortensis]MBE1574671.1 putative ABC transport system permease protein [Amycolatopsis roodepoortensis]
MWDLAWQTTKTRLSGFVGAFVAILCGTALVAGCGILMESGLRAGVPTQRYTDAAVVVGGQQTVDPPGAGPLETQQVAEQASVPVSLTGVISAVPGVRDVVAEQSFPATVVTADGRTLTGPEGGQSLGHNWDAAALAPFSLRDGRAPAGADEVVLDADLASRSGVSTGQRVKIAVRSAPVEFLVSGIAAPKSGDGLARQSAVFFSPEKAAELAGTPGQAHAIGVLADPGVTPGDLADRIRAAVGTDKVTVTTGVERSTVEFLDVSQTRMLLMALAGSFGGFALLIAVFVVASTLALVINQRRREFALLRAIAATPQQIRKLIGAETMIVAVVAGVLGSGLGVAVGFGLRNAFGAIGVIPPDFELAISPIPLVAALALGLGTARLAAWSASRRPSSIRPVEALGEAAVERRELGRVRVLIGCALVVAGLAGSMVPIFVRGDAGLAASGSSSLIIVIGLAVVSPKVVAVMTRLIAPVLNRTSRISGYLAAANNQANSRRLAAAVTPVMLAVSFALTMFYSQTSAAAARQEETVESTTADHVLASATGGLSPEVAEAARRIPGVAAATPVVRTEVINTVREQDSLRVERYAAQGLDGAQIRGNLELGVVSGKITDLTGNTVAMSESEAGWYEKKIGDEVEFYFGDGAPAKLRLVATYTRDQAFGRYVLPADLARAHTGDRMDDAVLVRQQPDADAATVTAALNDLATRYPGLAVTPGSAVAAPVGGQQQAQFYVNLVAVGVILGYVVISVANTLVMSTAQRSREFALLRLVGTSKRQVVRMMRFEALATAGIAALLGTVVAGVPLVLLNLGLRGTPLPSGTITVFGGVIAGAILLGVLSLGLATRVALRSKPIEAIGLRE